MKQLIPSHQPESLISITQAINRRKRTRSQQKNNSLPIFTTQQLEEELETQEITTEFKNIDMFTYQQLQEQVKSELTSIESPLKKNNFKLQLIRPQLQGANGSGFRSFYNNCERYKELQQLYTVENNIYGRISEKIKSEKVMPRTLNMFSLSPEKVVADQIFGSDKYVKVFAEGLGSSHFKNLKRLQLRNNNLNSERASLLTQRLPNSILELDYSNNKIGKIGINSISTYLTSANQYLQVLNLEDNNLKDNSIITILNTLINSKTIKILKLSKNQVSDLSMEQFSMLIRKSKSLQEVYFHFNQIKNNGGIKIFKALMKNSYMKVLDLSFNKLGQNLELINRISDYLNKGNCELFHLDLSYNKFDDNDSFILHKALIYNQTLFGFHFQGNQSSYYINPRGFLVSQNTYVLNKSDPQLFKRIESVSCNNNETQDNCWICEGWCEIVFKYTGVQYDHPIFLHLEFEDYRPMLMEKRKNSFELSRMCPPNKPTKYFFSNPLYDVRFIAKDQKTITLDIHNQLRKKGCTIIYADGTQQFVQLSIVNYCHSNQKMDIIDKNKHYSLNIICRPRESELIIDVDLKRAKQRIWSVENSIFKDFQSDTDGHLLDCFEYDFECGKLIKHLPQNNELEVLKEKMKVIYKYIIACYHYYCALTLNYELPCINQQNFLNFMSQTNILEKSLLNSIDLQLIFLSSHVIMKTDNYQYVKEKNLVRFQFVEILVRLAKEQYVRTGITNTIGEALERLFNQDSVLNFLQSFGIAQDWRDSRFWTELMDYTIRSKYQILNVLFDYSCKLTFKHGTKYISIANFCMLFDQLQIKEHISEKELYLIYLQSMQTQRDELNESKHIKMELLEFIEALARVAEYISPISPMYALTHQVTNDIQRRTLPLFAKFEALIILLYQKMKNIYQDIPNVEQDIVYKTVLKSEKAKKLGIFEEDYIDDKYMELTTYNVLPSLVHEHQSIGWNKLRQLAKKQSKIALESKNILNQLSHYKQLENQEFINSHKEESIETYKRLEEMKKKKEYEQIVLYNEPQFLFEQN